MAIVAVCLVGLTACSDDSNGGGGDGVDCASFRTDNQGGESCSQASDCPTVACPCSDGSTVSTTSCINGVCQGASACEDACAPDEYACMEQPGSGDEDAGAGDDAGNGEDNDAGTDEDTGSTEECVQQTDCTQLTSESACNSAGCDLAGSSCKHTCEQYPQDSAEYVQCQALSGGIDCPNTDATTESACTESAACAWVADCQNSVQCSQFSSEADCAAESTCSWQ